MPFSNGSIQIPQKVKQCPLKEHLHRHKLQNLLGCVRMEQGTQQRVNVLQILKHWIWKVLVTNAEQDCTGPEGLRGCGTRKRDKSKTAMENKDQASHKSC